MRGLPRIGALAILGLALLATPGSSDDLQPEGSPADPAAATQAEPAAPDGGAGPESGADPDTGAGAEAGLEPLPDETFAGDGEVYPEGEGVLDGFNRAARSFNFWFFDNLIEPFTRGYNFVMPKWGQDRVLNLFENLDRPRDTVNSLLQWKPARAGNHAASFAINSTLGVLGLFDPASNWIDVEPPETFDETLGVWGLPPGAYIVLPALGDSCPRCIAGRVVDSALNPLYWYPSGSLGLYVRVGTGLWSNVNFLARQMPTPFASETEWQVYENRIFNRPDYPEAKRLFFENRRLDVED